VTAAAAAAGAAGKARARDDAGEDAAVERDTRVWLERVVMGMSLCPFARASMPGLRVHVTRGRAWRTLLASSSNALWTLVS